jgi:dipeptidyl aminopeptidase/acylaminoacyl peptidase
MQGARTRAALVGPPSRRLRFGAAGLVVALMIGAPRAAGTRSITETDLFKFTWVADPQIAPDGSQVAFVRVVVNEKENRYDSSIFLVSATAGSEPRRITASTRDLAPRWSPDGKRLAFVRSTATQPNQIYLLSLEGGEARALTELPRGANAPAWSPDGRTIAFSATATPEDLKKAREAKEKAEGQEGQEKRDGQDGQNAATPHKSDVKVITRAVYRANGNPDFLEADRHPHIWTIPVVDDPLAKSPEPKQITSGEFDERIAEWSPDGATIYFTSTRVAEPYYEPQHSELYSVPATGGAVTKVAAIEGTISDVSLSPDGRRVAFVGTLHGNPVRSYSQPDLWVSDAAPGGTPKNLTAAYDFDVNGGIGGDQAAPRGENRKPIVWSPDSASLVLVTAERGSANLERISIATGKVEALTTGAQDVVSYTATRDRSKLAAIVSTATNVGDIFLVDATRASQSSAQLARLTRVNDALFKDITQTEPEEIWYTSFDGKKVQGWILKPPDFDPSRKYPMILEIHGGPHSAYGNTYTHEFMWMAAKGYVVLYTNPRGSTSYGQDFGNIIQYHYPGDDYKDLMAGVDDVVKRGYVDPNRLGVTGGSGGGLLTNWTITQTQRFKAAVAQRDIADWYGFWFTADFTLFQPTWFRKAPWEDPQDFAARSPITHVANVTTPLMLVLGDTDFRTPPPDGGEMMFRALKYRKIPTVMVRFPRENHELSRSGEPWHRVERLRHIVGWMDQWLQGKRNDAYTTVDAR